VIIVEAIAGLANRIRSAVSGLILGEDLGEPVNVCWTPQPGICAAAHHQLFADSDSKTFVESVDSACDEQVWRMKWRLGTPTMFERRPDYRTPHHPIDIPAHVLATHAPTVRISTYWNYKAPTMTLEHYFQRYSELLDRHFRPLDIGEDLGEPPTHGIHIRRGDKTEILRQRFLGSASNPARCERAMRRILRDDERSTFLLCSDDADLKRRLRRSLGERVHTLEDGPLSRDSVAGMCFAARELYALGRVGTILGDGDSSFGPTAAQYRNIPYVNLARAVHPRTRRLLYAGYVYYRRMRKRKTS